MNEAQNVSDAFLEVALQWRAMAASASVAAGPGFSLGCPSLLAPSIECCQFYEDVHESLHEERLLGPLAI